MADLTDILRVDDKILDLVKDIEVVQALETLMTSFREKRAELADFQVSDVFEFIDSIKNDQNLFNALGSLGLDPQKMKDAVTRVSDALGSISWAWFKLVA